jgi:hypothetical protein
MDVRAVPGSGYGGLHGTVAHLQDRAFRLRVEQVEDAQDLSINIPGLLRPLAVNLHASIFTGIEAHLAGLIVLPDRGTAAP